MDGYRIALFLHLLALLAAVATSARMHLIMGRAARATTVEDAREWHTMGAGAARMFPISLLVLLATGMYMVQAHRGWVWGNGWVEAGVAGVATLLLSGGILAVRARRLDAELERIAASGEAARGARLPVDPMSDVLGTANTMLALSVVLVMTLKPAAAASFAVLVVGFAAGIALGLAGARAHTGAGAADMAAGDTVPEES